MTRVASNSGVAGFDTPLSINPLVELLGTWLNTNAESPEIVKAVLASTANGLMIRVYGADNSATVEWGQAPVAAYVSPEKPQEIGGFEAHLDSQGLQRLLAANLKLGVLVIQCYVRHSGGESPNYFTREFFHKQTGRSNETAPVSASSSIHTVPSMKAADVAEGQSASVSDCVELDDYLGIWHNTCPQTRTFSHLKLMRDGTGYLVHVFAVSAPADWGAVPVVPFAESVDSRKASGFFADYTFGFMQMRLAANFNKGLLIVAGYSQFRDGDGRASYFTREFFYPERAAG